MRRLSLPRPHLCDAPNHYSATRALTLFLSIDTGVPSRPGHSASRYISSIHAVNDTTSTSATIPDNGRSVMTRRRPPPQRQNRDADVIVGDLRATLEAHRATNRASIIRAIPSDNLLPDNFVRPAIQYVQNEGQDTKGKVGQRAPRGDVVDQEMKTQPSTTFYRPLLSLDGETAGQSAGMSFYWPVGQWSRSGHTPKDIGRPWLDHLDEESGDGLLRLQAEIIAFEAFMSPGPEESAAYKNLIQDVQRQVRKTLPDSPIEVIGSHRTGLATSTSDLDFRLSLPEFEKPFDKPGPSSTRPKAKRASIRQLKSLSKDFASLGEFHQMEIRYGRTPIISCFHFPTQLNIQIQALRENTASREYVLNYLAEFPTLRPLYILIKTMLEMRDLRDVHLGGLGAYSIFMMVVAALKNSEGSLAPDDISRQLLSFLKLYSEIDMHRYGISVDPFELFPKTNDKPSQVLSQATFDDPILRGRRQIAKVKESKPFLLCLQDPANPFNDLGSKAHEIERIQAIFRTAKSDLERRIEVFERLPFPKATKSRWSREAMLDTLVGGNYRWFQSRRARVKNWAWRVLPDK